MVEEEEGREEVVEEEGREEEGVSQRERRAGRGTKIETRGEKTDDDRRQVADEGEHGEHALRYPANTDEHKTSQEGSS